MRIQFKETSKVWNALLTILPLFFFLYLFFIRVDVKEIDRQLFMAVEQGDLVEIKELVKEGANLEIQSKIGPAPCRGSL